MTVTTQNMSTEITDASGLKRCKAPSLSKTYRGYSNLLFKNQNFKYYILSHFAMHAGDAIVAIATLLCVENLAPNSGESIGRLVMYNLISEVFLLPLGGLLADSFDKRKVMIALDSSASIVVLTFIYAIRSNNLSILYAASILRSSLVALYHPVTHSIATMMVFNPEDLKRTTTVSAIGWSVTYILGGLFGGVLASSAGLEVCYVIDSTLYVFSAILMYKVRGDFNTALNQNTIAIASGGKRDGERSKQAIGQKIRSTLFAVFTRMQTFLVMTRALFKYIFTCGFSLLLFMKASSMILIGADDIIAVMVTEHPSNTEESSIELGKVYAFQGLGNLLGPILFNIFFIDGNRPSTLQVACIVGFAVTIIGWYGIANISSFQAYCIFIFIRSMGSSTIYWNSTLLLQNLASTEILGRILSYDKALASFFEACAAYVAGELEDNNFGRHEISTLCTGASLFFLIFWSTYHLFGKGAARKEYRDDNLNSISNDAKVIV